MTIAAATDTRIIVWDAIMGRGKTETAIAMMNEAQRRYDAPCFAPEMPDEPRFIYIAPFLAQAERIKNSCPSLAFAEPEQTPRRKLEGLNRLIGRAGTSSPPMPCSSGSTRRR